VKLKEDLRIIALNVLEDLHTRLLSSEEREQVASFDSATVIAHDLYDQALALHEYLVRDGASDDAMVELGGLLRNVRTLLDLVGEPADEIILDLSSVDTAAFGTSSVEGVTE